MNDNYNITIPMAPKFLHKQLKITSINFQIYKYETSSVKKGNKSLLKTVLLKRNIFNLFLKISTQGRGVFWTEGEFGNSRGRVS